MRAHVDNEIGQVASAPKMIRPDYMSLPVSVL